MFLLRERQPASACGTAIEKAAGVKESEEGQKVAAAAVVVVMVRSYAASGDAGSFHFEGARG